MTGEPLDPGPATVRVYGTAILADAFPPFLGEYEAEPDGRFSISDLDGDVAEIDIGSDAVVEYPIPPLTDEEPWVNGLRRVTPLAYFGTTIKYPSSDVGSVAISPTCLTVGDLRLASPLQEGTHLRLQMLAQGKPGDESAFTSVGIGLPLFDGSALEGGAVRFLARGDFPARLRWTVIVSSDGAGEEGESGEVSLPVCPRHEVLEYEATIGPA